MIEERIYATRKIEFDAAHRVIGHSNKCKYLHGHRYVLEITVYTKKLCSLGMVVDFGILKSVIKEWIDFNFDHNTLLSIEDRELGEYISNYTKQKVYYLKSNPTAENIAIYLKKEILPKLFQQHNIDQDFVIEKIRLYETPNCFVDF